MDILDQLLNVAHRIPPVSKLINRAATHVVCSVTDARPLPFSLWSHVEKPKDSEGPAGEYTSWPMLTDQRYSARHLPPAPQSYIDSLPPDQPYNHAAHKMGDITALFARKGAMQTDRSSLLFMFFAQWFTDSVLRVDASDRRKNTSNHNIDLCQIYGLKEETTRLLRARQGGRLKSQMINGAEYPDYLGEVDSDGAWRVKTEYQDLPYADMETLNAIMKGWPKERWHTLYATGLERGNSSVGYVAISAVFLREHNRICAELARLNPKWDDEQLFQTARMINIVLLMKLVVVDYINHIVGYSLFRFDRAFAEWLRWYRTPWISLEFNLLYRWHGLVPDEIRVGDQVYPDEKYRFNNALLESAGLETIIDAASRQPAGKIGLGNVPDFLWGAEYAMIKMGRDFRLQSYNDYRKKFRYSKLTSFDELTDDPALRQHLKDLYGHVDKVEYVVGLFAQKHDKTALFGDLLNRMVAYDAFTQIYTNPLLAKGVYTRDTFTAYGLELIDATHSIEELVARNSTGGARPRARLGV